APDVLCRIETGIATPVSGEPWCLDIGSEASPGQSTTCSASADGFALLDLPPLDPVESATEQFAVDDEPILAIEKDKTRKRATPRYTYRGLPNGNVKVVNPAVISTAICAYIIHLSYCRLPAVIAPEHQRNDSDISPDTSSHLELRSTCQPHRNEMGQLD
ncbi:hypothetical protein FOZ62_004541, partial [Perkinsus olseni]